MRSDEIRPGWAPKDLGEIRQVAYATNDLQSELMFWTALGAGPFFVFETNADNVSQYLERPTRERTKIALGNFGRTQLEFLEPKDDQPSMIHDFLKERGPGLHHVAFWTREFDRHRDLFTSLGLKEVMRSENGGAESRLVFFKAQTSSVPLIELSEVSGSKGEMFEMIERASVGWDGLQPVRSLSR